MSADELAEVERDLDDLLAANTAGTVAAIGALVTLANVVDELRANAEIMCLYANDPMGDGRLLELMASTGYDDLSEVLSEVRTLVGMGGHEIDQERLDEIRARAVDVAGDPYNQEVLDAEHEAMWTALVAARSATRVLDEIKAERATRAEGMHP